MSSYFHVTFVDIFDALRLFTLRDAATMPPISQDADYYFA